MTRGKSLAMTRGEGLAMTEEWRKKELIPFDPLTAF
jgi:hypothetical protein